MFDNPLSSVKDQFLSPVSNECLASGKIKLNCYYQLVEELPWTVSLGKCLHDKKLKVNYKLSIIMSFSLVFYRSDTESKQTSTITTAQKFLP